LNTSKILLLAFRKSHKDFFIELQKESPEAFEIKTTREFFTPCFRSLKDIKKIDFKPSVSFAVDEFYAKTELKVPRFLTTLFFNTMARINYMRYYSVFDGNYAKVLIWNGGKFRQRIAIEIAKKIFDLKVSYFENGSMPHRLTFDNKGINYENSLPRERAFYEQYESSKELPTDIVQRRGKREHKFSVEKQELPQKYIFVPFQVDYDTQIITNSPWIKNMRQLFSVIEAIAQQSQYHFILKEHPSSGKNYDDLHQKAQQIENISFGNGYLTQELIENAQAVITVNSTVGMESLLFHKKVIVLGNAFYTIEGMSFRVKNAQELQSLLTDLDKIDIDLSLIDKFLKYVYYEYLISNDEVLQYKEMAQRLLEEK